MAALNKASQQRIKAINVAFDGVASAFDKLQDDLIQNSIKRNDENRSNAFNDLENKVKTENGHLEDCETCSGQGFINCPDCGAKGYKQCIFCNGTGIYLNATFTQCNGKGRNICVKCNGLGKYQCYSCRGTGKKIYV